MQTKHSLRPLLLLLPPLILLLIASHANAEEANQYSGILNRILEDFTGMAGNWAATMQRHASNLFMSLALIQVVWIGAQLVLEKDDMQSFTAELLKKMMWLMFFMVLVINGDRWIPLIIDSFQTAGSTAAGLGELSPTAIFGAGIDCAGYLMRTVSLSGASAVLSFFNPFDSEESSLGTAFALIFLTIPIAFLIIISFAILAGQLLIALIESYLVITAGLLFLGFGGSQWTVKYTQRFFAYIMAVGTKLLMIYLLTGVAIAQAGRWAQQLETLTSDPSGSVRITILAVAGGAISLAYLAVKIPDMAASFLGGEPALNFSGLKSTAQSIYHDTAEVADSVKDAGVRGLREYMGFRELKQAAQATGGGAKEMLSTVLSEQRDVYLRQSWARSGSTMMGRASNRMYYNAGMDKPTDQHQSVFQAFTHELRERAAGTWELKYMSYFSAVANRLESLDPRPKGEGTFKKVHRHTPEPDWDSLSSQAYDMSNSLQETMPSSAAPGQMDSKVQRMLTGAAARAASGGVAGASAASLRSNSFTQNTGPGAAPIRTGATAPVAETRSTPSVDATASSPNPYHAQSSSIPVQADRVEPLYPSQVRPANPYQHPAPAAAAPPAGKEGHHNAPAAQSQRPANPLQNASQAAARRPANSFQTVRHAGIQPARPAERLGQPQRPANPYQQKAPQEPVKPPAPAPKNNSK